MLTTTTTTMMMVSLNNIQNENRESFLIEIEALHNILPPHLLLHNDDNADGSGGEGDNDEDLDEDALPHNLCLVLDNDDDDVLDDKDDDNDDDDKGGDDGDEDDKKTPIERRYDHVAPLSPRHTLALPLDAGENE